MTEYLEDELEQALDAGDNLEEVDYYDNSDEADDTEEVRVEAIEEDPAQADDDVPEYDEDEDMGNDPLDIAGQTLLGDLMAFVVDNAKAMPDVWQRMSEQQQREYIDRCQRNLYEAVERCVDIIACGEFITVEAILHKMTVEKGVDIVLKAHLTEELHNLQDHMKEYVTIVLPDKKQFTEDRSTAPKAEPDQADMIGIGEEYENQ